MFWATLGYVAAPYSDQSQVQGSFADRRATARGHSTGTRRRARAFATPTCRRLHRTSGAAGPPLTAKAVRQIAHRYISDGLGAAVYAKQRPGAQEVLDG